MSEVVRVSRIQGRRVVHGVVVGGERVGVVVVKSVVLLIVDQTSGQEAVDRERVVGSVASGGRGAEVHFVQFVHGRTAVAV